MMTLHTGVENALSQAWEGTVLLGPSTSIEGREHVRRAIVTRAPAGSPQSVIIKRYRNGFEDTKYEPGSSEPDSPASHLFNDWASLLFLNELYAEDPIAPRLFAGDRELGFIVMEDVPGSDPLRITFQGDNAKLAQQALIRTFTRLGQLHARTADKVDRFIFHRQALGPFSMPGVERYLNYLNDTRRVLENIGVNLSRQARLEMEKVCQLLAEPGPFLVLTHGDAVGGNWSETDGQLRLFDYEAASPRHALFEGAFPRMHFPTSGLFFVNHMPQETWRSAEAAYRQALIQGCPVAADDQAFFQALTAACAFWVMTLNHGYLSLELAAREDGSDWINLLRQRILLRLDMFVLTTMEYNSMEAFGQSIAELAENLRRRWPPEADELPYYPAFN